MTRRLQSLMTILVIGALLRLSMHARADNNSDPRGLALFQDGVKSLLADRCLNCHGGKSTKGDFNLATRESLLESGMVEPGDSKASQLLELVRHAQEPFMPFKGEKLSDEEIKQIAKWIDLGAPYDGPLVDGKRMAAGPMKVADEDRRFWSFRRLVPVEPPRDEPDSWSRTPIDRFVHARLTEHGIRPNKPATGSTLIRRVYFDLLGLPPTPEEVANFVADKSPNAYERLVDRVLANPHFGERWASHWLDIVRFAESHGFEHDHNRDSAYHYRDFAIRAFNEDMPYDRFVQLQLAGDELEPDNPLALMATGFLAAGVHNTQITASQVEKERYDELDDIVATIGTSMLALTIGCARCHDHKYDPIPTADYYRMVATFTTTVRSETNVELNGEEYRRNKANFNTRLASLVSDRDLYEKDQLPSSLREWAAKAANLRVLTDSMTWVGLEPVQYSSRGYKNNSSAKLSLLEDGSLLADGANPVEDEYEVEATTTLRDITAVRLEALTHDSLPMNGPGRAANGNFALSSFSITAKSADGTQTVEVPLQNARATFEQNHDRLSVASSIDADNVSGWAIDHGGVGQDQAAVFEFRKPIGFDGGTVFKFRLAFRGNANHGLGRFRLSIVRHGIPADIHSECIPQKALETAQSILSLTTGKGQTPGPSKLSKEQVAFLMPWYRNTDPTWQQLNEKVTQCNKAAPKRQMARILYCSEGVPPLRLSTQGVDFFEKSYELERGDPNRKVHEALPGFLQIVTSPTTSIDHWKILPPDGVKTSFRRRSLAKWITDPETGAGHLLARVIVNRLWQHHLGRGLVATPSDFGLQGESPSHPELIDWLANELIQNGWHLKPIHRLILTSAAYMQESQFDSSKDSIDPTNKWLWRYSARRIEAESIRDAMLTVSGTLDDSMFGPSEMESDHRRRSIYFFLKRSEMPRMMHQFDCPDGLLGQAVRSTTTVAPQALLLMNDERVQQWAEKFAERIEGDASEPTRDVVIAGYNDAVGRAPSELEQQTSLEFLRHQMSLYETDGASDPYHLAVTDFCQALFCLNEFVYVQ